MLSGQQRSKFFGDFIHHEQGRQVHMLSQVAHASDIYLLPKEFVIIVT
jgi:hypothetical protein